MPSMERSPPPITPQARARVAPAVDWLLSDGRDALGVAGVIEGVMPRLLGAGLPVSRLVLGIRQLHPELFAVQYVWHRATGRVEPVPRQHGADGAAWLRHTPVLRIVAGAQMLVLSPDGGAPGTAPDPAAALHAADATGSVILPLVFSGGHRHPLSFITEAPAGFSEHDIACLVALLPALTTVVELKTLDSMSSQLLDLYVGHDAGERILRGTIRRGDGETIRAALWFCDLAAFTVMSERLPRQDLIRLLNAYFDAMAGPVQSHGGTVLKFIGDGMLAIFRVPEDVASVQSICRQVLEAARAAGDAMARLNRARAADGEEPLRYAIALHVGDVMYGNIGAARRLDFTVIGPAVNLAARLQELAHRLGRPVEQPVREPRGDAQPTVVGVHPHRLSPRLVSREEHRLGDAREARLADGVEHERPLALALRLHPVLVDVGDVVAAALRPGVLGEGDDRLVVLGAGPAHRHPAEHDALHALAGTNEQAVIQQVELNVKVAVAVRNRTGR